LCKSYSILALNGLLVIVGCAGSRDDGRADQQTFLTGSEQSVVDSFAQKPDISAATRPVNSLDYALDTLLTRAYPPPDRLRLISGAMDALCDDYGDQTHHDMSPGQHDDWLRAVVSTNSFAPILSEIERSTPANVDQRSLVRAGLRGMLPATGWKEACLLTDAQAADLKKMSVARDSPVQERGVLGLNLSRWPEVEVIPGSPAADAGVQNGDRLLHISGRSVAQIVAPAEAIKLMAGPPGNSIQLTFERNGKEFTVELRRVSMAVAEIKSGLVAPRVVYIAIPLFEGSGIADRIKRIIQDRVITGRAGAVVIDLRGNPGGRPEEANAVADIFLDAKCLEIMQFRNGRRIAFRSHPGGLKVRLALLTDGNTGSSAEMLAMALRDNGRAVIIGKLRLGHSSAKTPRMLATIRLFSFVLSPLFSHRRAGITRLPGYRPMCLLPQQRNPARMRRCVVPSM